MERLKLKYYFAIYSAMSPASPELTTFAYTIDPGTFAVFIRQLTYHAFGDAVIGESDNYSPGELLHKYNKSTQVCQWIQRYQSITS